MTYPYVSSARRPPPVCVIPEITAHDSDKAIRMSQGEGRRHLVWAWLCVGENISATCTVSSLVVVVVHKRYCFPCWIIIPRLPDCSQTGQGSLPSKVVADISAPAKLCNTSQMKILCSTYCFSTEVYDLQKKHFSRSTLNRLLWKKVDLIRVLILSPFYFIYPP